ncbi:hypothetical protein CUMW_254820 [Citrus unshiu]|uniref:Leucine-rich repeat-containing N-terminal plant-type domain-containing protein n=1 Tax=Citrus unshiu TaxID=55188 RepID=A0A2H5QSF5_CITUN|nr:hypothetical protein CUMW_254820 [Citrus unshiu]
MSRYCSCRVTIYRVCDLHGKFPEKILQVPTLETLDLSYLNLANTSFLGTLPECFGTLENLTRVDLRSCNFTRPIPTSMANLTKLFHMDFSSINSFDPITSLHKSRNLNYLDLSSNNLSGGISSTF